MADAAVVSAESVVDASNPAKLKDNRMIAFLLDRTYIPCPLGTFFSMFCVSFCFQSFLAFLFVLSESMVGASFCSII